MRCYLDDIEKKNIPLSINTPSKLTEHEYELIKLIEIWFRGATKNS